MYLIFRNLRRVVWLLSVWAVVSDSSLVRAADVLAWRRLGPLPDREGFAGSFAGVHGGVLIVAGGANFPEKRPWEGGKKVWYDSAFVLDRADGAWRSGFKLPRAVGYGVSASLPEGMVCAGGSDADGHSREVFLVRWEAGQLATTPLPSLPKPCANQCGAVLGRRLYVAGGSERPDATATLRTFWSLDLDDLPAGWQELPPWPGAGRILAVAGAQAGSFFLFGGADLKPGADGKPLRAWLRDAYRYTPGRGWARTADLPRVAVGAPSPAPSLGPSRLLILGGDDGSQVDVPPTGHRGFCHDVLAYDTAADTWAAAGRVPFSLVTTPAVQWNGRIVVPGGEARPGIRSPEAWCAQE